MSEQYRKVGNGNSIRAQVFKELDENPLNTAKKLAVLLKLPYKQYHNYLTKLRSDWKYYHRNERGSRCSNYHCYKACVVLGQAEQPAREIALVGSWVLSKARNKFLVWRGKLGRVVWFGTGRVLLFVKKPGNLGKAKQLFCDAFASTGLITDLKVVCEICDRIRPKSGHFPYETTQVLPRFEIRDFVDSHGILIKVGDRSHPNAVEVIAEFTSQLEKMSDFMDGFSQFFESLNRPVGGKVLGGEDYAR